MYEVERSYPVSLSVAYLDHRYRPPVRHDERHLKDRSERVSYVVHLMDVRACIIYAVDQ